MTAPEWVVVVVLIVVASLLVGVVVETALRVRALERRVKRENDLLALRLGQTRRRS